MLTLHLMRGEAILKLAIRLRAWWQTFEKSPKTAWRFSLIWLTFICSLAFLWNLGSIGLIDETEPLFAEAARQMVVTGDWITPYFNGETRFDKPPLIYWLMAIGYKLLGVNAWAVRLPSALAAIALTFLCFYTLRYFGFATPAAAQQPRNFQRQLWFSALIGSTLTAFNLQTLAWARQGVSDMLLSGCMGTALLCFFWGYARKEGEQRKITAFPDRWYLAFYVLSALAVLTKGPVGIVIPGIIILSFLLYVGKLREVLQESGIIWGTLIFLAITLPWYVLVTLRNGDAFINSFFGYHNLERFTSVVNNHSAPWYFYFLIVLALFAPWSVYLPLAIARLRFWQRSFWCQQPRRAQLSLFAFFWFVDIFVFFSVSVTKLPSYVLPLIPAVSILVALVWSQELTRPPLSKSAKFPFGLLISAIFNSVLLLILAIASLQIPNLVGSDAAMKSLSDLIAKSSIPLQGGIIWAIAGIVCFVFLTKRKWLRWIVWTNLLAFAAFIIFFLNSAYFLVDEARQLPLRDISALITQVKQPQEKIVMIGFKKPSVTFYTQESVAFFWTLDRPATEFLQNLVKSPASASTILMVGLPNEIADAGLLRQDYRILGEKPPYQLIRVPAQSVLNAALKNRRQF
jgi:4-amino-4-deoxy-L-arabinose transferase-like glycosyltransferase